MTTRAVVVLVSATLAAAAGCGGGGAKADQATIQLARNAYAAAKARGVDFAAGPCLGTIKPDWVADVAHDPRRPVDDDPANQCPQFRSGEARHFVELDPDGRYIRSG